MGFVHLHSHTAYSILDSTNKIPDYVRRVKELGMDAAAITDHGVMYGCIEFYKECKKNGINPVIGCEVYVAPGSRFDKDEARYDDRYYHLILLAENNTGYYNLVKIVSAGFIDGFYYKPRVDLEILKKYHEGIICLSACLAGEIPRLILRQSIDKAREKALEYQEIFGKGNYYLELQDHGIPEQKLVNQGILTIRNDTGIPVVATNDCHYTMPEDTGSHDILLCLQTNKKVNDQNRLRYVEGKFYIKSEEEMRELFSYVPEAIDNTVKIAGRCHVEIEFGNTKLPHFEVPEGYDSWTYLNKLCNDGLKRRYGKDAEKYRDRLNYELSVIRQMGYVDYFLIVWDYINFAKSHGIAVGPGRGSAAGSIVSYTTGITDIDPIKYNLIFERFLNPERVSMPDIDVDFDPERRGEVIDYVVDKYGKKCVSQIVTFGTMKAKGVVRDVGRVLDKPYSFADKIAKRIPNGLDITLDKALEMNPELRESYENDPEVRELIDISKHLEGLPRNIGMHAAGVVIAQKPMYEFVPIGRGADGTLITQYEKNTIEELGLLKMDFLGLRNLTVIQDTEELVKRKVKDFDIEKIDYDDPDVYALIASGRTEGIFQLESPGMTSFMKELKPTNLEDIIAGISLYRPGPMDFIPQYIEGKNNSESIKYDTPALEPILSPTYGCIVYQEQVMQIVRDLAGYSMGRSDLVRRAMSKKKTDVMERERQNFVYGNEEEGVPGCVKNGISPETANKIYDEMIDFAKYAFNKSHAACYAYVAYMTAYLKQHYPSEFMAALMTSVMDSTSKTAQYILACRDLGIKILPPDVNEGFGKFSTENGSIRFGMAAIKGIGMPVVDDIVEEREKNGKYENLEDFLKRLGNKVNKKAVENLIKSGAMDCLPWNRRQKMNSYQNLMEGIARDNKDEIKGQTSLFEFLPKEEVSHISIKPLEEEEYGKADLLNFEKSVLGIYLSGHPLEDYIDIMKANVTRSSADFQMGDEYGSTRVADNEEAVIGGMINNISVKFTKNNQPMAFVTLEDLVGTVEVIVFPKDYMRYRRLLVEDNKIFIKGRVSLEEEKDAKLLCSAIASFDDVPHDIMIRFSDFDTYKANEDYIDSIPFDDSGNDRMVIYLEKEKQLKIMGHFYSLRKNDVLLNDLYKRYSEKNVKVAVKRIEFKRERV